MPFDGFFESVYRMAAKRPLSEFKQGVHLGDVAQSVTEKRNNLKSRGGQTWQLSPETRAQVKGGFCMGASLEWLRKVLQREDSKLVDHTKQSRVLRMTSTHLRNKAVNLTEMFERRLDPDRAAISDLKRQQGDLQARIRSLDLDTKEAAGKALESDFHEWVKSVGGSVVDGKAQVVGSPEVLTEFSARADAVRQIKAQLRRDIAVNNELYDRINVLVEQAKVIHGRATAQTEAFNASSTFEVRAQLWNDVAAQLDAGSTRKRKFSGIVPVASSKAATFATARDFVVSALSAPEFAPGRGMIFSMDLVPEPGHAIALHRDSREVVLLFDPNLGVYKFSDLKLLALSLIVLMEVGYTGKDSKGKVTELGSKHGWQIYARSEALMPVAGANGYASAEDVRLALDAANEVIATATEMAEWLLETTLAEAQRRYAVEEKLHTPQSQADWVEAHNEAVDAFRRVRGVSVQELLPRYAAMDNAKITLT
jgi:hypothetical protein